MPWTPASFWALRDANAEHLRTVDTFFLMAKAKNVHDLLRLQDKGAGMPWVNTTAADRSGEVLYADHSVVPNVPDELADACMTPGRPGRSTRSRACPASTATVPTPTARGAPTRTRAGLACSARRTCLRCSARTG